MFVGTPSAAAAWLTRPAETPSRLAVCSTSRRVRIFGLAITGSFSQQKKGSVAVLRAPSLRSGLEVSLPASLYWRPGRVSKAGEPVRYLKPSLTGERRMHCMQSVRLQLVAAVSSFLLVLPPGWCAGFTHWGHAKSAPAKV